MYMSLLPCSFFNQNVNLMRKFPKKERAGKEGERGGILNSFKVGTN